MKIECVVNARVAGLGEFSPGQRIVVDDAIGKTLVNELNPKFIEAKPKKTKKEGDK